MLLTITYTGQNATDLGYLLHKNPQKLHSFELGFGNCYVFYPEVTAERCTVALLLEINPVDLAKSARNYGTEASLFDYVNDRPYVASSFLSVALSKVFGTALSGRSKERPELVEGQLDLEAKITMLPASGGADVIRRLFEPLGYEVVLQGYSLSENFPEWGESRYFTVDLKAKMRLLDLLNQLYILIPVLDLKKHYWIGEEEIVKLIKHGEGWLAIHPEKELITNRYLKRKKNLINRALNQLQDLSDENEKDLVFDEAIIEAKDKEQTGKFEERSNLNQQRLDVIVEVLQNLQVAKVIDLGCGEGKLLNLLMKERCFTELVGMDASHLVLEKAVRRLNLERLAPLQRERIRLFQSSLIYQDQRFRGYDAVTVIEVIEHLDLNRLVAFEQVLFEFIKAPVAVITTPNREYNMKYPNLGNSLRHTDHRFEWTRAEFQFWASNMAERYGYQVSFVSIGEFDSELGAPTQMGVFTQ